MMSRTVLLGAALVSGQELNFLAMGDWGTAGSAEKATAHGLNVAAGDLKADFTLALGDNFYSKGVKDVDDSLFQTAFEDVFTGEHLTEASGHKFHLIAGNHDHYGNANAQVEYSQKSTRWSFPSLWYKFSKTAPDGATVDFVMIDTVEIAGQAILGDPEDDISLKGNELPGPRDLAVAESQMQWIDETLAASTADYVIVSGHYPVYSAAEHGPTGDLSPAKFPYLQKYNVSAYLCGHDHVEQHIDMGDGVQYHVIGSAAKQGDWGHLSHYTDEQMKFKAITVGGFGGLTVSKKGLQIRHYDGSGKLLYTAPMICPRGGSSECTEEPAPAPPTPSTTAPPAGACADETSWPDLDHDLVCGECKVLVDDFQSKYVNCDGYCASMGRTCTGAWEEDDDTCDELFGMSCGDTLDSSDAICRCSGDDSTAFV